MTVTSPKELINVFLVRMNTHLALFRNDAKLAQNPSELESSVFLEDEEYSSLILGGFVLFSASKLSILTFSHSFNCIPDQFEANSTYALSAFRSSMQYIGKLMFPS